MNLFLSQIFEEMLSDTSDIYIEMKISFYLYHGNPSVVLESLTLLPSLVDFENKAHPSHMMRWRLHFVGSNGFRQVRDGACVCVLSFMVQKAVLITAVGITISRCQLITQM